MEVRLVPDEKGLPISGGVRQHCQMLRRFIAPLVTLTDNPDAFTHVQSSYVAPRVDVYTCHGGFLPHPPIQSVIDNLNKAKRIISVAQWIVDDFFPELAHKTVVIPNGVCLADWDAVPEGESGLEPGYILVKGYMAWSQHWRIVVDAIQTLRDWRFVSIGMCPTVSLLGLHNLIILKTPIMEERMARLIKDCAAFISPSSEVNPVMAMEAMACRKPVFGLDFHGNREVLMTQCRYSDAAMLTELIRMIGVFPSVATTWGQLGRDQVETLYNWEHIARDILAVYEDVAA